MDFCNNCFKNIASDIYFDICKECKKVYCSLCSNKISQLVEESSIKCVYILNSCFTCNDSSDEENYKSEKNLIIESDSSSESEYEFREESEESEKDEKKYTDGDILQYVLNRLELTKEDVIEDIIAETKE